jgi:bacterioferritin
MSANLSSPELDRMYPFLSEVAERRRRARKHIEAGTNSDSAAVKLTVLRLLNEALTTELVCVLRYQRRSAMSDGTVAEKVRNEFLKYAREEQGHADQIAERIVQLGGEPNLAPLALHNAGHAEDRELETLADMLEEDIIAERIAIESYREIVQYLGSSDPVTCVLLQGILAVETGHAEELASMREEAQRQERAAIAATSPRLPVLELQ